MLSARGRGEVSSSRRGFTTIEIVVVLAVLAILAAVITRNVVGTVNTGRSAALAESLDALRQSIYAYRGDVRRYPTNLQYLSSPPVGAVDICGRPLPAAFVEEWRGPYTAQAIPGGGKKVGEARVLDALQGPGSPGIETAGLLSIVVENVDFTIAEDLEHAYDDSNAPDYGAGTVRWIDTAPTGDGSGTLYFGIAIRGC